MTKVVLGQFLLRQLAVSENSTRWSTLYQVGAGHIFSQMLLDFYDNDKNYNMNVMGQEHRYSDPFCSLPLFSLTITATLALLGPALPLSPPFKVKFLLRVA